MADKNQSQLSFWPSWESNKLFTVLLGILLVYGIVFMYAMIQKTLAQSEQVGIADQQPASITVTAQGMASAKPDQATVDLSITTDGATSNAAQDDNSTQMNALIVKLQSLGLAEAKLKTSQYYLSPVYDYDVSPAKITGYQATQTLTVTIDDTSLSDLVLAAAGDLGVTSIGQLQQTVSDTTAVEQEAREEAIAAAYIQAYNIAAAMGQEVGKVVSYYESVGSQPYPYYGMMAAERSADSMMPPVIAEGENESSISVTITYGLK